MINFFSFLFENAAKLSDLLKRRCLCLKSLRMMCHLSNVLSSIPIYHNSLRKINFVNILQKKRDQGELVCLVAIITYEWKFWRETKLQQATEK